MKKKTSLKKVSKLHIKFITFQQLKIDFYYLLNCLFMQLDL